MFVVGLEMIWLGPDVEVITLGRKTDLALQLVAYNKVFEKVSRGIHCQRGRSDLRFECGWGHET